MGNVDVYIYIDVRVHVCIWYFYVYMHVCMWYFYVYMRVCMWYFYMYMYAYGISTCTCIMYVVFLRVHACMHVVFLRVHVLCMWYFYVYIIICTRGGTKGVPIIVPIETYSKALFLA